MAARFNLALPRLDLFGYNRHSVLSVHLLRNVSNAFFAQAVIFSRLLFCEELGAIGFVITFRRMLRELQSNGRMLLLQRFKHDPRHPHRPVPVAAKITVFN
jgi:hypothetical protein